MRTNIILAIIAALLAFPTIGTLWSEAGSFTQYETVPRLFEGFTPESVDYVRVTKAKDPEPDAPPPKPGEPTPMDELVLQKRGDTWVLASGDLAGVPVRGNKVEDDVLNHIKAVRRDQQVLVKVDADDAEMERRGLTEKSAIRIECLTAQEAQRLALSQGKGPRMADLYLGKDASGGQWAKDKVKGFFVARYGEKDIILYEPKAPYWRVSTNTEDWIDNKVHQFDKDKVKTFSMRNPVGSVTFVREEGAENADKKWKAEKAPDGVGAVRQQEVEALVGRFAYANVQRYVGSLQRNAMLNQSVGNTAAADYEVSATLDDGTVYTMWVFKKIPDKNEYHARFAGTDENIKRFVMAVGDWVVTSYEKDPKDYFDPSADAIKPPTKGAGANAAPTKGSKGAPTKAETPTKAATPTKGKAGAKGGSKSKGGAGKGKGG